MQSVYFTPLQVAEILGVRPTTIWRWIREGTLTSSRINGRIYRISQRDIDDMMRRYRTKPRKQAAA